MWFIHREIRHYFGVKFIWTTPAYIPSAKTQKLYHARTYIREIREKPETLPRTRTHDNSSFCFPLLPSWGNHPRPVTIPLSARQLFCRGGNSLPMSSVYFRHFRLCQLEFKNTALSKFGMPKLECSKIGITFLLSLSSALPLPKIQNLETVIWFGDLLCSKFFRFGCSQSTDLGFDWDRVGKVLGCHRGQLKLLHIHKVKLTTSLNFFNAKLTTSQKNEVDQEFKKIQTDHLF